MTPRDRVLTTLAHEEPDRIPLDFSANAGTLERLMRDLRATTYRELLDRLHVDIVDLRGVVDPVYVGPRPKETLLPDGTKENFWGWRTRRMETATGPEECFCHFALAGARSVADLEKHPWPRPDWFDFSAFAARLEPWRDRALMASGASMFQHPTFLRGIDNLLADMAGEPEMFEYLCDRFTDFYLDYYDRMFAAAPGRIDLFRIADDLAMQDRLLISPAAFQRFFAPRLAKLVDLAHRHKLRAMFHSCGAVAPLVDSLVDLGVDVLDPLQVRARGMDPELLKRRYGRRVALHGAIDTQYVLPRGTPAEVAENVRQMARILGPGGGFVMAPSHVLQTDVPTANVLALYDTAFEFRLAQAEAAP
jgi:uroporphyrinogen decarboxylase